jgi:hypothetical protein
MKSVIFLPIIVFRCLERGIELEDDFLDCYFSGNWDSYAQVDMKFHDYDVLFRDVPEQPFDKKYVKFCQHIC